ncbi:MAG: hypothetical protein SF028_00870 [Candidatus Sumerlaeia bacterium]|nr:hypothetical protein [Candidatus Sumerlaeia bacterium]
MEVVGCFPFLLFALVGGLIVALVVHAAKAARRRQEALAAFAAQYGWTYLPARRTDLEGRWPKFPFLRQGDRRYAANYLEGEWRGHRACAFDYHWEETTGTGEDRRTTSYAATFVIVSPSLRLQPFAVRPEGIFDRVAEFFGAQDIDFESAEFSRRFHVSSPDRRWTFDLFHPRCIEFFMAEGFQRMACDGTSLAADWQTRILTPMEIYQRLERLHRFLDQMPSHLRAEGA